MQNCSYSNWNKSHLRKSCHWWIVGRGMHQGGPRVSQDGTNLKEDTNLLFDQIFPKTLWTWGNLGQEGGASKIFLCRSVTALCLPFVPACNNSHPLHWLISLHLLAHNISLCFWLCPSHSMLPFPPPPPCAFTPTCGPNMSSLYCMFYVNILIILHIILNILINS